MLQINRIVSQPSGTVAQAAVVYEDARFITFDLDYWPKMTKMEVEECDNRFFSAINHFLKSLSQQDQSSLWQIYLTICGILSGPLENNNDEILDDAFQELVAKLLIEFDITTKLLDHCKNDPSYSEIIPDMNRAGAREFHLDEQTLYHDDYIALLAINLLVKLMTPIMSYIHDSEIYSILNQEERRLFVTEIVDKITAGSVLEIAYKKMEVMIESVTNKRFERQDKLRREGSLTVDQLLKREDLKREEFFDLSMSYLLNTRFVIYEVFNLVKSSDSEQGCSGTPNLLIYADDGIKRFAETQMSAFRKT